jgi:copper homeostasis protein
MPAAGSSACLAEACLEDVASAVLAERAGAGSIELCSALGLGGVTPSAGLIGAVRSRVRIPLHVLIRPRAGSHVYDDADEQVMLADIEAARRMGADGVVFGVLSSGGRVHRARTERLVLAAGPVRCTCHHAFDATPDLDASMALLVELGVSRVLTSGGAATAAEGAATLARLQRRWGERITVLAGGGVRAVNVAALVRETGVRAVHLGPRRPDDGRFDLAEFEATVAALGTTQ